MPLTGLPGKASVGEDVLRPSVLGCSKMGWYPKGSSPSLRRRGLDDGGEWIFKARTRTRRRGIQGMAKVATTGL